jgi:glycosyltransferase involved in cell wall biosynthesis
MKIEVTIGLSPKNSETSVKKAVESIISQNLLHESMEIIIVDSKSRDKPLSLIDNSLLTSDIEHYLHHKHRDIVILWRARAEGEIT